MNDVQALLLGLIQGLTEFLPISSSGHLVLANYWFGFSGEGESLELAVDIATNTGTFLAVLLALRRDVAEALVGFLRGLGSAAARREPGWRLALLVLVGSVPTAALGLGLRGVFEALNAPLPVTFALFATGVVLWTAPQRGGRGATPGERAVRAQQPAEARQPQYGDARDLTFVDALVAGTAQGLAVIPGVSRSGSTIAALLWRDVDAAVAARLSFLMYLVASLGVAVLGLAEVREAELGWSAVGWMTLASFASGWLALQGLFAVLRRGRFRAFAPYLWLVAGLTWIRIGLF